MLLDGPSKILPKGAELIEKGKEPWHLVSWRTLFFSSGLREREGPEEHRTSERFTFPIFKLLGLSKPDHLRALISLTQ